MQPIKIQIPGDYFDCQIYRGRLYLWTYDGEIVVYNWGALIEELSEKLNNAFVMKCSFLDGSFMYRSSMRSLLREKDVNELLKNKFISFSTQNVVVTKGLLDKHLRGRQSVLEGELPIDTEIYNSNLYFGTSQGVFSTTAHRDKKEKYQLSSRPTKIWDNKILSMKANKFPQIALSAGEDGLFELNLMDAKPKTLKRVDSKEAIFEVSNKHSSFSNYSSLSIYNSSLIDESFMALFSWKEIPSNFGRRVYREYEKIANENEIFENQNQNNYISWGIDDKIYRATNRGFEIVKFNNYAKLEDGQKTFEKLQEVRLHPWKGSVLGGGTSYFGNIIECENALVVLMSDENVLTIEGPITRWRTYPRSKNFENQLHVIKENSIDIYSFYQDYFITAGTKKIGIEFKFDKNFRGSSSRFGIGDDEIDDFFSDIDVPF